MAKKTKKLPKKIFVKRHIENNDEWLDVGETISDVSEYLEEAEVGVYELLDTVMIENVTRIK